MNNIVRIVVLIVSFSCAISAFTQDWHTDLSEAQELARTEQQLVLLVFQGSDWCAPCIRMEREIWSSEEFKSYAVDNLVLVKADFPRRKENKLSKEQQAKNDALAEKYNEQGAFPLAVVMTAEGKVLWKSGFDMKSPKEYITKFETLKQ
jgi:thioredoxin-related protein